MRTPRQVDGISIFSSPSRKQKSERKERMGTSGKKGAKDGVREHAIYVCVANAFARHKASGESP